MQIDSNKFMNLVMEKTNQKLNSLQAQVIVLEAQLQCASEANAELVDELAKLNKKDKKQDFTN